MANVFEVSNYFLSKTVLGTEYNITPLKMQKLLFYAQGWYLGYKGIPLFEEEMKHWAHGPVVLSVYEKYRKYGYFSINCKAETYENLTTSEKEVIDEVWKIYGGLDGKFLEEIVSMEDPLLFTELNEIISKEKIKKCFVEKIKEESI